MLFIDIAKYFINYFAHSEKNIYNTQIAEECGNKKVSSSSLAFAASLVEEPQELRYLSNLR